MTTPISPSIAALADPSGESCAPLNEDTEALLSPSREGPSSVNAAAKRAQGGIQPGGRKRQGEIPSSIVGEENKPKRQKSNPAVSGAVEKAVAATELKYQRTLAETLSKTAQAERRETRERLRRDIRRLGSFRRGLYGRGTDRDASVQWDGGSEYEELDLLRKRIQDQKLQVEKIQQSIKAKKNKKSSEQNLTAEELEEDVWEQRELCVSKEVALKRAEADLKEKEDRLKIERHEHLRRSRAIEAEDQLKFGSFELLKKRYQLLRLLNRNSSIEVYQAYDVSKVQHCVVKIHELQLDPSSKETHLEAIRTECASIKRLKSCTGFAALLEHFELEGGSKYVMVWEFCEGEPFETFVLRNAPIDMKEARGMLLQLLGALRTAEKAGISLSSLELKPSRLIFRSGELKIKSIGLPTLRRSTRRSSLARTRSHLEVPGDSPGMETHEGDDDIDSSSSAIRIAGAIFYELLFNKTLRQQASRHESIALEFPDTEKKITQECKECLCRMIDRESHLTVQDICMDPFFAPTKKR